MTTEFTTTFKTAQKHDRVYSLRFGWGTIVSVDFDYRYPLLVEFLARDSDLKPRQTYTTDGFCSQKDTNRDLYWDEIVIVPPQKPSSKKTVYVNIYKTESFDCMLAEVYDTEDDAIKNLRGKTFAYATPVEIEDYDT